MQLVISVTFNVREEDGKISLHTGKIALINGLTKNIEQYVSLIGVDDDKEKEEGEPVRYYVGPKDFRLTKNVPTMEGGKIRQSPTAKDAAVPTVQPESDKQSIPRLASNGKELYEKFKALCKKGVPLEGHGVLYPIADASIEGFYRVINGQLAKRVGKVWDRATFDQENNVMYAFDHDMVQIELRDPDNLYSVLKKLHQG